MTLLEGETGRKMDDAKKLLKEDTDNLETTLQSILQVKFNFWNVLSDAGPDSGRWNHWWPQDSWENIEVSGAGVVIWVRSAFILGLNWENQDTLDELKTEGEQIHNREKQEQKLRDRDDPEFEHFEKDWIEEEEEGMHKPGDEVNQMHIFLTNFQTKVFLNSPWNIQHTDKFLCPDQFSQENGVIIQRH